VYTGLTTDRLVAVEMLKELKVGDQDHETLQIEFRMRVRKELEIISRIHVEIALSMARGFAYLHKEFNLEYIHSDINSSNIVLDGDWEACVADFAQANVPARIYPPNN
jgi:serine/threonine protein kinase